MAKTAGVGVEQVWMLPATVLALVAVGHLAHFVRDTVRHDLDLSASSHATGRSVAIRPITP